MKVADELEGRSQVEILALINEQGGLTGKTALHRALEKLKECYADKDSFQAAQTENGVTFEFSLYPKVTFFRTLTAFMLHLKPNLNIRDTMTGRTAQDLLSTLPKDDKLAALQEQFNAPDQSLALRKAVDQIDVCSIKLILASKSREEAIQLLESKGPKSGKTALHRMCEKFLACTIRPDNLPGNEVLAHMLNNAIVRRAWGLILGKIFHQYPQLNKDIKDNEGVTVSDLLNKLPDIYKEQIFDKAEEETSGLGVS